MAVAAAGGGPLTAAAGAAPAYASAPAAPPGGHTVTITAQRTAVCDLALALPLQTPAAASAFSQAQGSTSLEGVSFARSALE